MYECRQCIPLERIYKCFYMLCKKFQLFLLFFLILRAMIVYLRPLCSLMALITGVEAGILTKVNMEKILDDAGAFNGALSRTGTSDTKEKDRKITLSISGLREISHRMVDFAMDHHDQLGIGPASCGASDQESEPPAAGQSVCSPSAAPYIIPGQAWVEALAPYMEYWRGRLRLRHAWWVAWKVLIEHGEMKEVRTPFELQQKLCQGLDAYEKNLYKSERTRERVCGKEVKRPSQLFKHVPTKELDSLPPSQWYEAFSEDDKLHVYALCAQNIESHFDSLRSYLLREHAKMSGRR